MSRITAPVQQVLQARSHSFDLKIDTAVARQAIDAQQQAGDAVNALLEQAVQAQAQIADGRLDVKV